MIKAAGVGSEKRMYKFAKKRVSLSLCVCISSCWGACEGMTVTGESDVHVKV
jgi:hypothetical protein